MKTLIPALSIIILFLLQTVFISDTNAQELLIHYDPSTNAQGSKSISDASGNGHNGTLTNSAVIANYEGLAVIDLGTSNGFVDMGSQMGALISSMHDYSIVAKVFIPTTSDISGNGNFVWSFANSNDIANDANGCLFFSAKIGSYAISPSNWSGEQVLGTGSQTIKGSWQTIAYVQNEGSGFLYINGQLTKSGSVSMTPSELGATPYNYLGRPCYSSDAYLNNAKYADFRIYDAPLSLSEIEELSGISSKTYGVSVLANYEFDNEKDSEGNFVGTLHNGATLEDYNGLSVLSLGSENGYFDFSSAFGSIISQLDSFSISTNMFIPQSANLSNAGNFVWTFANSTDMSSTANGNMFLQASRSRFVISPTHWEDETNVLADKELPKGRWINVSYTQREGIGRLFINGYLVAQASVSMSPKELGATAYNYIGRSCYSGDAFLEDALFDNFIVYSGALSGTEIEELCESLEPLNAVLDNQILTEASTSLQIPNATDIRSNIDLPATMGNGISITWETSNANAITNKGEISRPVSGDDPITAELTATLTLNNASVTKTFEIVIKPESGDAESVLYDSEHIQIEGDVENITSSIELPTIGVEGSTIEWASNSPDYLSNNGELMQLADNGKKEITLTATITKGNESAIKTFTVWISDSPSYSSYLFAYFTGNDENGEQIRFAVSEDGFNYTPLNNGNRIMSSDTISMKKGVRDPHILRGEDGKSYYMVVTDMKSSEGWSSNRGIVMLKSNDLVTWTHATVHFPTKWPNTWGNVTRVWAPQTIYDPVAGKYLVYYSLLSSDGRSPYDRIYYSYANEDFTDLEGEPQILFDQGKASIDGDIVFNQAEDLYYMFFKNESSGGISQVTSRSIVQTQGQAPSSQWSNPTPPLQPTTKAVEGAGVFKLIGENNWVLMYDCYSDGHYQFTISSDLKNFTFVQDNYDIHARHGTTIPITDEEAIRIVQKWPSSELSPKPLGAKNDQIKENGVTIDHTSRTITIRTGYDSDIHNFNPQLYASVGTRILPTGKQDFGNGALTYTFTQNKTSLSYSVVVEADADPNLVTSTISLNKGWNLIAISINPNKTDIAAIFPNATMLKTTDAYYDASIPAHFSSLSEVQAGKAYFVYNTKDEDILISGHTIQDTDIIMESGWNMFGSQWIESKTLEDAFGSELSNIQAIKTFDSFWENGGNENSLENIEFGKGYFILR